MDSQKSHAIRPMTLQNFWNITVEIPGFSWSHGLQTSGNCMRNCKAPTESRRCGGSGGRKRAWLRCRWAVAGPGRASRRHITTQHRRRHWCGGCRRDRRARAGFEIDHSEPQARVWRSRGRPGPKAPDTQAPHHNLEPRPTSARRPGPKAPATQALLTDTSMSREKRGALRTGNRVP
mgnify:CR=1 FL=1